MDADRNKATETPECSPGVASDTSHSNQHPESWGLMDAHAMLQEKSAVVATGAIHQTGVECL